MKSLINILFLTTIFSLNISGCSTEKQTNKNRFTNKKYSSSTQQEFENIERNDLKHSQYTTTRLPLEKPRVVLKEREKVIEPQIVANSKLSEKNQERLQEINQNLAFFCMKHRQDSRFKSENQCLEFTKKVLVQCEKKHNIINSVMVSCIKEQLKKR